MLQTAPAGRESCSPAARRRAALFAGLCVVLAALASSSVLHEVVLHALKATQSVIEHHTLLGVVTFVESHLAAYALRRVMSEAR